MSSESLLSAHEVEDDGEEDLFINLRRNLNMEARAEHQKAKNYRVLYALTTCAGTLLVVLVLCWCLIYRGGFAWSNAPGIEFNWHPFLMVVGLIYVYAQSMLVYRTARNLPKNKLKITHAVLHCTAFVLAVIALKAVFDSHNLADKPIPNLYTLHSWIGLVTVIIFTAQFVFGFASFLYPGFPQTWRVMMMPIHTAIGTGTFVLAIVTAMMGLTEKALWAVGDYSAYSSEGLLVNFIGVILVIFGVLVLYLVNEVDYKRSPLASDGLALSHQDLMK